MEFTFGVLTYNNEQTILTTLESIKYQVVNYGKNIDCNLVISDDNSSDNTNQIVKDWLKQNKQHFLDIQHLISNSNNGISSNYCNLIKNINTNYFIKVDGDDVISSKNVIDIATSVGDSEMLVFLPLKFKGENLWIDQDELYRHLYYTNKKLTNRSSMLLLTMLSPFYTVQIVFQKKLISENCMQFIRQFRNFEDNTTLFYILNNNKNVHFKFVPEQLVLYRRENSSITVCVNTSAQISFLDDLHKYRKITLKCEKNCFVKLFLALNVWNSFLMKHRFSAEKSFVLKLRNYFFRKIQYKGKLIFASRYSDDFFETIIKNEKKKLSKLQEVN